MQQGSFKAVGRNSKAATDGKDLVTIKPPLGMSFERNQMGHAVTKVTPGGNGDATGQVKVIYLTSAIRLRQ